MITREELIIRMMPFHDQLVEWCKNNPQFLEALKIVYPDRFIALGAIYTSTSPYIPDDEVIGFVVYDIKKNIFKQDFIINRNRNYNNFILYTKLPKNMPRIYSKFVRPIKEFYNRYGKNTHYLNTHHIKFDDLDEQLKQRATSAIKLARNLEKTGLRQLNQKELQYISDQLRKEKHGVCAEVAGNISEKK